MAAVCYASYSLREDVYDQRIPKSWPWEKSWWKSGARLNDLIKAGALIAAEIDRMQDA